MWTSLRTSTEPAYPRDRSCGPRVRFWVLAVGIAVILFLLGFLIGWLANKHAHQLPRTDAHKEMMEAFLKEMKAESIKQFLYNFTQQPHLAGTQENLHLAEQIQANWKAFGLDSVQLAPYDVLLSYPNETSPNYISLVDEHGQEKMQQLSWASANREVVCEITGPGMDAPQEAS
ncbi:glutamate carboxypeptidase 2-like [Notechis scutatus]|uniref:Glutamate carboxypeptidase 2-like n=1 Tax=Notechis scutatus TaxID=8663 RepID=A0A6J1V500_9SAUR|nr:glutamate carboxypeptidase 2-like [Notechis scutatus]